MSTFFCYYCGEEYDDEDDLQKKCPTNHLRSLKRDLSLVTETPQDSGSGSNWAANLDKKITDRLEKKIITNLDALVEKSLEEFFSDNAVEKKAEKYKCGLCVKYFKGPSFVRKHIMLRHQEKISEVKQKALEEQFFTNYSIDPNHITPMNIQNNNNGHMGWSNWGDSGGGPSSAYYGRAVYSPYPTNNPYHNSNRYYSGGGGGSGGGGQRRGRDNSSTRFRPSLPGGHPPEPEYPKDPRKLKDYVDLDAPTEDAPIIDYRSTLAINNDI